MKTEKILLPVLILSLFLFASCLSQSRMEGVYRDLEEAANGSSETDADEGGDYPSVEKKEKFVTVEEPMADEAWEAEPPASASPPPESGELSARGEGPPVHAPKKSTWRKPSTSGLRAGFADDNKQFNYFLQFLDQYRHQGPHYAINIQERIVLKVRDENGNSAPNSKIEIYAGNEKLCEGLTYSDGSFLFFPLEYDRPVSRYKVVVTRGRRSKTLHLDRWGRRLVHITLPFRKGGMQSAPLDILFIMDTTGSMGEEIERLKKTLEIIKLNLASLSSRPTIRFGMVLYKDRGDVYVTRTIPLTGDVGRFQTELNRVRASGGGDGPEDLQSALRISMEKIRWSRDGVRLGFIITDAAPHLDYGQSYTYPRAASAAREKGVKLFSVGTGGLDIAGEYVLRQISQYTHAKYIFLTYGEEGESGGGRPGSVSHHTGANYRTDKLEAIIIRIAKDELGWFSDASYETGEEYFAARETEGEEREETLQKLFDMALSQLVDYSAFQISGDVTASVLPISPKGEKLGADAEYLTERLILALAESGRFKLVARKDFQEIADEMKLQMTELMDPKNTVRIGKLLGAETLVAGALYSKGESLELFLKLLRVETGEILSVTKLKIDPALGVSAGAAW